MFIKHPFFVKSNRKQDTQGRCFKVLHCRGKRQTREQCSEATKSGYGTRVTCGRVSGMGRPRVRVKRALQAGEA